MNQMVPHNNPLFNRPGMVPQVTNGMPGMHSMMPGGGGGGNLSQIFWGSWWLILICVVLGGAGVYIYLSVVEPTYTSVSRILVDKSGGMPMAGPSMQTLGTESKNYLQTQAVLITSPEIIYRATSDPNNTDIVELVGVHGEKYLGEILKTLQAYSSRDADIVFISASAVKAEHAAVVVNAVVKAYQQWLLVNRKLGASELLQYLNAELKKSTNEFEIIFKKKVAFEKRNPHFRKEGSGTIRMERLELIKRELATARQVTMKRMSYYLSLRQYAADVNDPELDADEGAVTMFRMYVNSQQEMGGRGGGSEWLQQQLFEIQSQLDLIGTEGVASKRMDVLRLESQKKQVQEKIRVANMAFVQNSLHMAGKLAEEAEEREKLLERQYRAELADLEELSGEESDYALLVSQCNMLEGLCNSLIAQIRKVNPDSEFQDLNVHVISPASVPNKPSSPQLLRVLAIGLTLGLMVGGGLAFLRDLRNQTVRSASEITALLGVPILGAIPKTPRGRRIDRGVQGGSDSTSIESEAFRAVRTTLLFGAHAQQGNTILVTSPAPMEGKTTVASQLAMAMANAGQRTLIVDADLRKPRQHLIFRAKNHEIGLADILSGGATLLDAIRATELKNLDILTSGRALSHPAELLNGEAMARLLSDLEVRYDRIIVDSPPVGIVVDAQILATLCSLTLLVVRADRSTRMLIIKARDALHAVDARIAGAVINDVSRKNKQYGYYHSYRYQPS